MLFDAGGISLFGRLNHRICVGRTYESDKDLVTMTRTLMLAAIEFARLRCVAKAISRYALRPVDLIDFRTPTGR